MKNKILKGITYFMGTVFLLSASAINDVNWLPEIICAITLSWLFLFLVANRKRVINEII